jgi:hypothetical protein
MGLPSKLSENSRVENAMQIVERKRYLERLTVFAENRRGGAA